MACAKEWKKLNDQQKKVYIDAAAKDFVKYKQELTNWELKMVRLGNTDIVRDEAIVDKEPNKPKRRPNTKKALASSDSDWRDEWYSSNNSLPSSSISAKIDSSHSSINNPSSSSSPPPLINNSSINLPKNHHPLTAESGDTEEVESKSSSVSSQEEEGMNTTKIEKVQATNQHESVVPEDEKSKRVIDKLKNFFKF